MSLALFGHSNPCRASDVSVLFFLAQQRTGTTLEPFFLNDGHFRFVETGETVYKLGIGSGTALVENGLMNILDTCLRLLKLWVFDRSDPPVQRANACFSSLAAVV